MGMAVTAHIPSSLDRLRGGRNRNRVGVSVSSVSELLGVLEEGFPALVPQLYDSEGMFGSAVNVFVDGEDIRLLEGEETPLRDGQEVSVIPLVAGARGDDSVGGRGRDVA
jgi:molybdopterin synthase sulfur carrier subunit